jgi:preprotein translocase subunit Sec61beta
MTDEKQFKPGPDWFVVACAVFAILLLGTHCVSILENVYYDPLLFLPFGILAVILLVIIFLLCKVLAYEFVGKSKD